MPLISPLMPVPQHMSITTACEPVETEVTTVWRYINLINVIYYY